MEKRKLFSEFDDIIRSADARACVDFFDGMSEPDRKLFSERSLQWANAIAGKQKENTQSYFLSKAEQEDVDFYTKIMLGEVEFSLDVSVEQFSAAAVAVLSSCNLSQIKKSGNKALPEANFAFNVLANRRPSWLGKWCTHVLKISPVVHWKVVYDLEKAGLCTTERNSIYWQGMAAGIPACTEGLTAFLRRDGGLRSEVYSMLDNESATRDIQSAVAKVYGEFTKSASKYSNSSSTFKPSPTGLEAWMNTLPELVNEGLLDRQRLIDYTFLVLARTGEVETKRANFRTMPLAYFPISLNSALIGSEVGKFADRFIALLSATERDVASYALETLFRCSTTVLRVDDICAAIPATFLNSWKEPPALALKLLEKLLTEFPAKKHECMLALLHAFSHKSTTIRSKALSIIEKNGLLSDQELLREFSQRIDMLVGFERTVALKLLEQCESAGNIRSDVGSANETFNSKSERVESMLTIEEAIARGAELRAELRRAVRFEEAVKALADEAVFDDPVDLRTLEFPRLNSERLFEPIDSFSDLIYLFMKVCSGSTSAMELEQLLDGIARFNPTNVGDFTEKSAVLRQKLDSLRSGSYGWSNGLKHLADCWMAVKKSEKSPDIFSASHSFFVRRCFALANRVADGKVVRLLSTPTHEGGWIAPKILVTRFQEYLRQGDEPDVVDVIQAYLRLAPEQRLESLPDAQSIRGELGRTLRFALGSDLESGSTGIVEVLKSAIANVFGRNETSVFSAPELWVAAFRARLPFGTFEELKQQFPTLAPDCAEPARYFFDGSSLQNYKKGFGQNGRGLPNFLPVVSPDSSYPEPGNEAAQKLQSDFHARLRGRKRYAHYPTALLHDNANTPFTSETISYCWLHNRESYLAMFAKYLLINLDSTVHPSKTEFDIFFDPDIDLAFNGRYVICLAMTSKNPEVLGLSVDLLAAAVSECRVSAEGMGEAMAQTLGAKIITVGRWVSVLRDVYRISPLHASFVWSAISKLLCISGLTAVIRTHFLELLAEIQLDWKFQPNKNLQSVLDQIEDSGKSAQIAKALMAQKVCDNEIHEAVALQSLESRLRRAERWQARS
jgi:hypothetical protein